MREYLHRVTTNNFGVYAMKKVISKLELVTVRYDNECQEYAVTVNGACDDKATYFTDNKADAIATARVMNATLKGTK
jgi:uncharacterized protein with WD repeat